MANTQLVTGAEQALTVGSWLHPLTPLTLGLLVCKVFLMLPSTYPFLQALDVSSHIVSPLWSQEAPG